MNTDNKGQSTTEVGDASKLKIEAQAKTAIEDFLKQLKIQKIIYIDDRCSINELKDSFIGKLNAFYDNKPQELDFANWELSRHAFDIEIKQLWDSKSDEQKKELFLKVLKFENNTEELHNSTAPLKLKDILKDKIELLSPSEWDKKKDIIIKNLTTEFKILFLFDIEFGYSPLSHDRNGLNLAAELLLDNKISGFLYCGIFSHLFNTAEEYEKRIQYCKDYKLQKERFYTISKKRFQNDSYLPALAEGIRNTLLINEVETLKKETSRVLKKAFKRSMFEIDTLAPESFNHVIQRSSKVEGVWEMSTLFRISNIITSYEALNSLLPNRCRGKINKSLEKIRKVEAIITGGETPFDKTQVNKLRSKELYIDAKILNQLHYPLSNGDIFKIQDKEYILLVQPCNVSLRNNGYRDRKYNIGFLVGIETVNKVDYNSYKKGQLATLGVMEDVSIPVDSARIARFSTFQSVSLSPLDLTVFNEDGKSRINLNKTTKLPMIIQESWRKRHKKLQQEFSEYSAGILKYRRIKIADKNILKKSIYNGALFTGYQIDNENSLFGKRLEFNITRLSNYKPPYSNDLLQKFMSYLSRNAFEHDFTN